MTQDNKSINNHIEEYLDYYCNLYQPPGFAILLKGQWGSGKTWFINKYREKLKNHKLKSLYVSLYGMSDFSEIEDAFFQQLHPILSSKGMAITGKILKGFAKGALKIDWDADGKDDGNLTPQYPEINLPDYFRNTDENILIFDDLERCNFNISNILGYINYFVEHQGLKVIIIANELELPKDSNYAVIKEKLIGKTFNVFPDFERALESFILSVNNLIASRFLSNNLDLIKFLYEKVQCDNLRILKQIILDFERIFNVLPEKAKNKSELLQELLQLLMAFSIEIRRGRMYPKDISQLREESINVLAKQVEQHQLSNGNKKEQTSLQQIIDTYPFLNLYEPFPSTVWWESFFDKGILDIYELNQSLVNSKYFQDENTPDWVRLWHFHNIDDEHLNDLIRKVESDFSERKFDDIGVIKHITGIFLNLSNLELYFRKKEDILKESKLYIDWLRINRQSYLLSFHIYSIENSFGGYLGLGFQAKELKEYQELSIYIKEVQELTIAEHMPKLAQDLLDVMQNEVWKFHDIICLNNQHDWGVEKKRFSDIPFLIYIKEAEFVDKFIPLGFEKKQSIFWALSERYKFDNVNSNLIEELDWLKSVRKLLLEEIKPNKGKISAYNLNMLIEYYLDKTIEKLELKGNELAFLREITEIAIGLKLALLKTQILFLPIMSF